MASAERDALVVGCCELLRWCAFNVLSKRDPKCEAAQAQASALHPYSVDARHRPPYGELAVMRSNEATKLVPKVVKKP